jgi:hypothetical protein
MPSDKMPNSPIFPPTPNTSTVASQESSPMKDHTSRGLKNPTAVGQVQSAVRKAAGRYEYMQRKAKFHTQKAAEKACETLKTSAIQMEHFQRKAADSLSEYLWKCWKNLQRALRIWTKLALTMRWRDRLVKIIQYGCQMLVGYWAAQLAGGLKEALVLTRSFCSNARKAFWLLKTLNHLGDVQNLFDKWMKKKTVTLMEVLTVIEQLGYGMYYLTENLIFAINCKLLKLPASKVQPYQYWSWLVGDFAGFIKGCINIHENSKRIKQKRLQTLEEEKLCKQLQEEQENELAEKKRSANANGESSDEDCMQDGELLTPKQIEAKLRASKCCLDLQTLNTQQFDLGLQLVISIFEVGVSAHYCKLFRPFNGGKDINDGHVGLMGVISSGLILFEGARNVALGDSP